MFPVWFLRYITVMPNLIFMETRSSRRGSYLIPGVLVLLVVALAIWLTPVWAQNKREKQGQAAKTKKIIIIDENGNQTEYNDLDKLPSSIKATTDLAVASAGSAMALADGILKAIDVPGITREVTTTLSEVKVSDIAARIDMALSEVNWSNVNREVERAMDDVRSELNDPAVKEEVKASLRAAQQDLADASASVKTDVATARRRLQEARLDLTKASEAAASEISVDSNVDRMLDKMEYEGLIDRRDGFEICKQGNRLYINGEEQGSRVYGSYERYLGNGDITIEGIDDDVTIRMK